MERDGRMDEAVGRAKEAAGALVDDEELRNEGRADQAAGKIKNKLSEVVDKARDAVQGVLGGGDEKDDDRAKRS